MLGASCLVSCCPPCFVVIARRVCGGGVGAPSQSRPHILDNGPEFTAQPLVDWCAEHGVAMHYIQPGKPGQNAYIERFNRSYRTEVLNAYLFESLTELRALTDAWLSDLQRRAAP